jgi:hypothetical protein
MTDSYPNPKDFLSDLRPGKLGRFAILRFDLHVEYCHTEGQAVQRLKRLKHFERVALVDRETGFTHCLQTYYRFVMAKLRREKTAPERFARTGSLRYVLSKKGRKKS